MTDATHALHAPHRHLLLRTGSVAAVLAFAVSGAAYAAVQVTGPEAQLAAEHVRPGASASAAVTNKAVSVAAATQTVTLETEEAPDPFQTVRKETDALPKGKEKVTTEGKDGSVRTTYRVTTENGKETAREALSVVAVTERTDKVVMVGTGTAATVARAARSAAAVPDDGSLDDDFARLAQCESGGNPRAVNPAGYYGLYQFSIPTWRSVGGTGNPADASVEEQTARAKALQARSGWGQWSCGH